jgi:phosphatidylglycerophosphatase B
MAADSERSAEPIWHSSPRPVLARVARWLVPAWIVLPASALLPALDLTGLIALVALAFSNSAQRYGMPFVVLAYLALIVTRSGLDRRSRLREGGAMVVALALFLVVGAELNEHVVKPAFASPRPDIVELAERGVLPIAPNRFYELGGKRERREYLSTVLSEARSAELRLSPAVREHWLEETGYSFPSGHSTAAMLVATFFLCVGLATLRGQRTLALVPLLPWALSVCVSRPVLRVHRPMDITLGAMQGTLLGVGAFLLVWTLARPKLAEGPSAEPAVVRE